jgi:hypothetical protein
MSIRVTLSVCALLVLLLATACSRISFDPTKDVREFRSDAVFEPTGRYAIQVVDIDLLPKETIVHVRLTDRSERQGGLGPDNYWRSPDAQRVFLEQGEDRTDKKPLVSAEPHGLWWNGDREMTLVFGPVDDADFQNTFKLQFLDFPEMQIHRTNPESTLAWIWAKTPSWVVAILFGLIAVAAAMYLNRHPTQAKSVERVLRNALKEISGQPQSIQQIDEPVDPVEVAKREDQVKMRIARERARNDVQFKTTLNMARDLDTYVAIKEWQRQQRHGIHDDDTLTADEKEDRLGKIDEVAAKEMERLNNSASSFAED